MTGAGPWPSTVEDLVAAQVVLSTAEPPAWQPPLQPVVAGCFVCFARGHIGPGAAGDPGWAAAASYLAKRCVARAAVAGAAGGPYRPGLLALRCGGLLETAVRALPELPDVLLVDATGYDHPRRAGLARHLGAVLDLPTVGVTHRPLLAGGDWPADRWGATSPLFLGDAVVGYWIRTRPGRRPLAVHAGWRTDPDTAADLVRTMTQRRTPEPLREARRLARTSRSLDP